MLEHIVTHRAAEIRALLDRGAFVNARVPLHNGGTLPAEMFAKIALGDLDWLLTMGDPNDDGRDVVTWRRLAEDVELLHEVILARRYAIAEQGQVPA